MGTSVNDVVIPSCSVWWGRCTIHVHGKKMFRDADQYSLGLVKGLSTC